MNCFLQTFVVGSSFVMANLTDIRYMAHKYVHKTITPDAADKAKKSGLKLIGQSSFEEEYSKMKKKLDIDNWENIRGPRDYEKPSEQFLKQVESLKEKNKNDNSTVYCTSAYFPKYQSIQ
ncbi:cytochrome c oxidase assembly protein COX16-like isoform X2 [Leptotrombidium deliense]|uniref:Cytochrome c oxidase assembly protein COX16 homolog, mitochondrial n=1 Tax=Leptotrombidium deliense TaxID=299467 RepID=A0A443SUD4_9ACAR|nr:cytochrome c oxidase assembly protein COX16-like isoform X2 [Leptotrombidium deliense]